MGRMGSITNRKGLCIALIVQVARLAEYVVDELFIAFDSLGSLPAYCVMPNYVYLYARMHSSECTELFGIIGVNFCRPTGIVSGKQKYRNNSESSSCPHDKT